MGESEKRYKTDEQTITRIGLNIRTYRKLKGLTQNDLSLKTGLSRSQLYSYENGKVNQNVSSLKAIADILEIQTAQLFDGV